MINFAMSPRSGLLFGLWGVWVTLQSGQELSPSYGGKLVLVEVRLQKAHVQQLLSEQLLRVWNPVLRLLFAFHRGLLLHQGRTGYAAAVLLRS